MKIKVLSVGEAIGADAICIVSKTVRWHRRPGMRYQRAGGTSNSHTKKKHYTKLLAEQALGYGWLNGVRIRRAR
jgi:hypothetical protein